MNSSAILLDRDPIGSVFTLYPQHVDPIFESRGIPLNSVRLDLDSLLLQERIPRESYPRLLDPSTFRWDQLRFQMALMSHCSVEEDPSEATPEKATSCLKGRELVEYDESWENGRIVVGEGGLSFIGVKTTKQVAKRVCVRQDLAPDGMGISGGTNLPRAGKNVLSHALRVYPRTVGTHREDPSASLLADRCERKDAWDGQVKRVLELYRAATKEAEHDFQALVGSGTKPGRFQRIEICLPIASNDPRAALEAVARMWIQVFPMTVASRDPSTRMLELRTHLGQKASVALTGSSKRLTFSVQLEEAHPTLRDLGTLRLSDDRAGVEAFRFAIESAVAPYVYALWKVQERIRFGDPTSQDVLDLTNRSEGILGGHKANRRRRGTLVARLLAEGMVPRGDAIETRRNAGSGGVGPFKEAELDHVCKVGKIAESVSGSVDGRCRFVRLRDPFLLIATYAGLDVLNGEIADALGEVTDNEDCLQAIDGPTQFQAMLLSVLEKEPMKLKKVERAILRPFKRSARVNAVFRRIGEQIEARKSALRKLEEEVVLQEPAEGVPLYAKTKEEWVALRKVVRATKAEQVILRARILIVVPQLVIAELVDYDPKEETLRLV